ncbi:hypothetical protein SJ_133 [Proteus phage SJ_PmiM]|nr:hypothetical protein SJ_133 [Proteus phage SJ_PmiM]
MKEIKGDILNIPCDAICITTNMNIKKNKRAVMGAGIARLFSGKVNNLDLIMAKSLIQHGHVCRILTKHNNINLISFPTKYNWYDKSDPSLIRKSALELMDIVSNNDFKRVLLPKPGCSNGGLNWNDIKPMLIDILDDRIHIIER